MARYALIRNALVENVILADSAPDRPGLIVVLLAANQPVSPGDSYDGATFAPYQPTATEIKRRDAPGRLHAASALLEQWAADEQSIAASWASLTAVQRDAANRQLHDRAGRFFERFGDLLIALSLD